MDQSTEISIDNVTKTFTDGDKDVTALSSVSMDIRKGEFVSLLGPSGCGKTTLLRIIADLIRPSSGTATVSGTTPSQARLNRKYGMVFQSPVLYEWRTIRKNIELPLEIMKTDKRERARRSADILNIVGLPDFADAYPSQLSGGMQQRVGIARALVFDPEILLMDEPFSALDEFTREKLQNDLLRIWRKTNKTIVFVTHSIAEAVYLSDRVFVLSPHPGRLSATVEIDVERPRLDEMRNSVQVNDLIKQVRNAFEDT